MKGMTEKQKQWSQIIKQWSDSGLTQADFCKQHNIEVKRFHAWKYQITNKKKLLAASKPKAQPSKFVALTLENKATENSSITISFSGTDIHYTEKTNEALLIRLLRVLKDAA